MPQFTFADLTLESSTGEMLMDGAVVGHLPPRVVGVMIALMRAQGRVVTNDALLDAVWRGRADAPMQLAVPIHRIRAELKKINSRICVQSIYGTGYLLRVKSSSR